MYIDRPELRAKAALRTEQLNALPDIRRRWAAAKAKRCAKLRRTRLGWCPEEYWPTYERMRKRQIPDPAIGKWQIDGKRIKPKRVGAAKARAAIERHLGGPLRPVSMTYYQLLRRECTLGGEVIRLAGEQARLLAILLMQNPHRYFDFGELIERMWPNPDEEPQSALKVIDQYIYRLRRCGIRIVRSRNLKRGYRIPPEARASSRRS